MYDGNFISIVGKVKPEFKPWIEILLSLLLFFFAILISLLGLHVFLGDLK